MVITLQPGQVQLSELESIYRGDQPIAIASDAMRQVQLSAARLKVALAGDIPIYGVNTGFGKLASVRIPGDQLTELQRNLVRSHCAGYGPPLPLPVVRLMLALKCISLGRGASGVRPVVIEQICEFLQNDIIPVVPEKGSVGASGDLAPLAHVAAALLGEGEVFHRGERVAAAAALQAVGLQPLELEAKEGLALLNGTQASTALALAALFDTWRLLLASVSITALSIDAAMGSSAPFRDEIHELRGHAGQRQCAARMRALLADSEIRDSHRVGDERVQDPYCLRCAPQVVGACIDQLRHTGTTLCIEANAATDNPLVLSNGDIVSGGNFHAEPVGLVADLMAIATSELGCIAQRRVALLVDPALSFGLPAFLAPDPGLKSGLMIAEVTSAALMSENKALANPRSVDSTPTSANQEDHVSMACHGARRLLEMNTNLAGILGVEAMAAAQGVELRAPLRTSRSLREFISQIRTTVAPIAEDRIVAGDIEALASELMHGRLMITDGDLPPLELSGPQ